MTPTPSSRGCLVVLTWLSVALCACFVCNEARKTWHFFRIHATPDAPACHCRVCELSAEQP